MADLYNVTAGDTALAADVNQYKTALEGGSEQLWALHQKAGANFAIRLATNDGTDTVDIQDSDGNVVASIDSNGTLTVTSFNFSNLDVPTALSPSQTTNGRAVWDSDDFVLTVGNGSSAQDVSLRVGAGISPNVKGEMTWDTTNNLLKIYDGSAVQTVSSAKKTSGGGYFLIPAGPAAGTAVDSSASANTYGSWVEMTASTAAALYIYEAIIQIGGVNTDADYIQLDIGTGAAASESSVSEGKALIEQTERTTNSTYAAMATIQFDPPIPVAASTRIACRTADSQASAISHAVTLRCINQSDLVAM